MGDRGGFLLYCQYRSEWEDDEEEGDNVSASESEASDAEEEEEEDELSPLDMTDDVCCD